MHFPFRFRCSLAWGLVWLGVVLATLSLWARWRLEAAPTPVEIALEWSDATRLSSADRVPLSLWLGEMKKRGARGVTLNVQNVRDLAEDGRLTLWGRAAATPFYPSVARLPSSYLFVVACRDEKLLSRVRRSLNAGARLPVVDIAPGVIAVALSPSSLATWPVGLDPAALEEVRRAKMEPLARLGDWAGATPVGLQRVLHEVRTDGVRIVVAGDPVPGFQTLSPETARLMRLSGLSLAWVEGDTTRGTPDLASRTEGFLVRSHLVSSLDILRLEPGAVVDRFARAARERNVRLFLVRLPRAVGGETDARTGVWKAGGLAQQLAFVSALERETRENRWERAGRATLSVGLARRFGVGNRSPRRAALARFGAGLGTVGATILVIGLFLPLSPRAIRGLAALGIALVAPLSLFAGPGAQILSLGASLVFPLVALAWSGVHVRVKSRTRREATWKATQVLLRATALSFAGGLIVAATLNDWTYWTKVSDFWGTKAASIAPVALLFLLLLGEFWPGAGATRGWVRVRKRLRVLGRRAFPLRDVMIALAAMGVVALWLARSGNDSGVAVSEWEWKFRALLETLFVARPRTKEFLLCHPALVAGALCLFARQRHFAWPLLGLGIIGQINVVNSFAQANNPLYVPLWRTILSLGLGGAFGALLCWPLALRLGFARDPHRWSGWPVLRRTALATGMAALVVFGVRQFSLRRRYAELVAPSQNTTWPWNGAKSELLRRGVTHWASRTNDGTTLDLLLFDFKANPRLKMGLWDADLASSPDPTSPRNRFAYWNNGFASQAAQMNARGDLVACWNAGFFGLLNRRPRGEDRAFHLSPVVSNGRAFYRGANHRWTWGVQMQNGLPKFKLEHEPDFASLGRDFDCASGTLQALMVQGQPLELRPLPWFGVEPQKPPVPSTPREAGHIPTLDWMHTSRAGAGWNDAGQLWVLLVKEPDGEAPSRALVGRRERGRGGWTLADLQRFWLSMRASNGVQNAVGFDGGDVLQSAWRQSDGQFQVLAPRIALPSSQSATLRLQSDGRFLDPRVRALNGSALSYFFVREEAETPVR